MAGYRPSMGSGMAEKAAQEVEKRKGRVRRGSMAALEAARAARGKKQKITADLLRKR